MFEEYHTKKKTSSSQLFMDFVRECQDLLLLPLCKTNFERAELEIKPRNHALYQAEAPSFIPTDRNSNGLVYSKSI